MKIKFNTDDNIPLNRIIYFPTITLIIRSVTKKMISEGIDTNETSASKRCNILPLLFFLDKNFNYGPYLSRGCHDLMQKAVSFKNVAVVFIKGNDYRLHFWYMSKKDAIAIMTNSNLSDKNGVL